MKKFKVIILISLISVSQSLFASENSTCLNSFTQVKQYVEINSSKAPSWLSLDWLNKNFGKPYVISTKFETLEWPDMTVTFKNGRYSSYKSNGVSDKTENYFKSISRSASRPTTQAVINKFGQPINQGTKVKKAYQWQCGNRGIFIKTVDGSNDKSLAIHYDNKQGKTIISETVLKQIPGLE